MGKISLELTANASSILDGTENVIDSIQEMAAQGKVTSESLKNDFAAAGKSTKDFNATIDTTVKKLYEEGKSIEALILKYGGAAKAQKAVTKELVDMAAQGKRNTAEFRELSKVAGELRDNIGDVRSEVNKLASDTGKLDKLVESGRAVAGAFSVAAGASALFGDENEDLQRSVQKAQGALALLTGVQELAKIATEKGGIATGIATAAQQIYTFAVGESVGALKIFRLALIGTGIGALVFLLYEAADAFGIFDSSVKKSTDSIEKQKKALDDLNKTIDRQLRLQQSATRDNIQQIDLEIAAIKAKQKANKDALDQAAINSNMQSGFNKELVDEVSRLSDLDQQYTDDLIVLANKRKFAIEDEAKAREKLNKAINKVFQKSLAIDKKALDENISQIVDAFGNAKIDIPQQVKLLRALGFNDEAIFKALSEAADKAAKNGDSIAKVPVEPFFIQPKDKANIDVMGFKVPINLDITQEEADKISSAIQQISDSVTKTLNTAFDTAIKTQQNFIDSLDKRISKQQEVVANEEKLAKAGAANNLQFETDKLNKLNEAREKALEKQKKIKNAQVALDTITQLSSLVTASAKIYESLANIPVVGVPLATGVIGAMFAAFAAQKIAAAVLTSQTEGFREGGYTGDGDPSDTSTALGNRGYKYHKREFVMNEELTSKHRPFFEALHNDDKTGIIYGLTDLLKGTGVLFPDAGLPNKLMMARDEYELATGYENNQELRKVTAELVEIKEKLSRIEKRPNENRTASGDKLIVTKGNQTTITKLKK